MTRSSVLSRCVRNPSFLASPGFCFFLLLLLCWRPLLDLERCRDPGRPRPSASAPLVSLLPGGESRSGFRAEELGAASLFIVAYHHPARLRGLLCIEAGPEMARARKINRQAVSIVVGVTGFVERRARMVKGCQIAKKFGEQAMCDGRAY